MGIKSPNLSAFDKSNCIRPRDTTNLPLLASEVTMYMPLFISGTYYF